MTAELSNTLPASWFREPAMYELERRAIFSKTWILISHTAQFQKPGQYARYEMAGYHFLVIRDRQNNINTFLNACRHRAFPLVHEDAGTAGILSCKYHGWSYGINGKLAKAPRFDGVEGFDKTQYSLYRVHTHIDKFGFLWINLDSAECPSVSWEEQFADVDTQPRLMKFSFKNYAYDHTWSMEGAFNWKTLVENYNECYHCQVAHPGIAPAITKDSKFEVKLVKSYIQHMGEENSVDDIVASPTYMFPNASVTVSKHFFYMMSIVPVSAQKSIMRYEFYRNTTSSDEDVKQEIDFFKQVEKEDKWLANNAQTNLSADTYVAGPLHPYMEKAVAYFETLVRSRLQSHLGEEKKVGHEIWSARRVQPGAQLEQDEVFCKTVCSSGVDVAGGILAW